MVTTMVNIKINGLSLSVPEGTTILTAAESHGISIPHLCYLEKINEIGACRLCCVEVKGEEKLVPSCITKAAEGMEVVTNSQRVRSRARTNLQFLMSQHDGRCTQCVLSGNCRLQTLCNEMGHSEGQAYILAGGVSAAAGRDALHQVHAVHSDLRQGTEGFCMGSDFGRRMGKGRCS